MAPGHDDVEVWEENEVDANSKKRDLKNVVLD